MDQQPTKNAVPADEQPPAYTASDPSHTVTAPEPTSSERQVENTPGVAANNESNTNTIEVQASTTTPEHTQSTTQEREPSATVPPNTQQEPTQTEQPPTTNPTSTPTTAPAKYVPPTEVVIPLNQLTNQRQQKIDCPWCHTTTNTRCIEEPSSMTMLEGVLCCLCCGIICGIIPCLCKWSHDATHTCSSCGKRVAFKPHDGATQVFTPENPAGVPAAAGYVKVTPPQPVAQPKTERYS